MARTTHRRKKGGKKLYARRGKSGQFKDIQTYKPAHGYNGPHRDSAGRYLRGKT
jgi:hypothetical protein